MAWQLRPYVSTLELNTRKRLHHHSLMVIQQFIHLIHSDRIVHMDQGPRSMEPQFPGSQEPQFPPPQSSQSGGETGNPQTAQYVQMKSQSHNGLEGRVSGMRAHNKGTWPNFTEVSLRERTFQLRSKGRDGEPNEGGFRGEGSRQREQDGQRLTEGQGAQGI